MDKPKQSIRESAGMHYLMLAGLFVSALITCNLVANKFVRLDLGFTVFEISAGILAYPITFLITDILSEIYGKKRTQKVVWIGFGAAMFTLFILFLGNQFPALDDSPVDDATYQQVFKNSWRIIAGSMVAYLIAQFIDVRVFHFWKRLTKGKMLWVRNNFSTVFSQFIDTFLVVSVIFIDYKEGTFVSSIGWDKYILLITQGWLFKVMVALIDTPVFYLLSFYYKKKFNLKGEQEMKVVF